MPFVYHFICFLSLLFAFFRSGSGLRSFLLSICTLSQGFLVGAIFLVSAIFFVRYFKLGTLMFLEQNPAGTLM
jgi:hypothetical protein